MKTIVFLAVLGPVLSHAKALSFCASDSKLRGRIVFEDTHRAQLQITMGKDKMQHCPLELRGIEDVRQGVVPHVAFYFFRKPCPGKLDAKIFQRITAIVDAPTSNLPQVRVQWLKTEHPKPCQRKSTVNTLALQRQLRSWKKKNRRKTQ